MSDSAIDYSRGRKPHKLRWGLIALIVAPMFLILLQCSGLRVPIIGKERWLNARLNGDFGVSLPGNTRIVHATYVMERDASAFYELQMPPGAAKSFVDAIKPKLGLSPAALAGLVGGAPSAVWTMGSPPPNWWRLGMPADEFEIDLRKNGAEEGFRLFVSPSTDRIFLFWYEL